MNEAGNRLNTRVSGCTKDFPDVAFRSEPARQGVLACTRADNKNSHYLNDLQAKMSLHGAGARRGSISLT